MSKKLEIKKIHSNLFTVPISIEEIQDIYKSTTTFITINTNRNLSKKELIRKAIDLHSRGKVSEAKKSYENCIRKNFEDPVLFSNYGLILKDEDKIVEAEKLFRKAIHLKPDYAEAYNNLGDVLRMNGQLNEAEIMIRKSLQLKENYADAHANLGTIFKILGRLDEALLSFDKASELAPNSVEIYLNKGAILLNLGKLKEAEKSYRAAIKIYPNLAVAFYNIAVIYKELGKYDDAIFYFNKAYNLEPSNPKFYVTNGLRKSDIGIEKLFKNDDLINIINDFNWSDSKDFLDEFCERHHHHCKDTINEFIKLWCNSLVDRIDYFSTDKFINCFINLIVINEHNKDIDRLIKFLFSRVKFKQILQFVSKKDQILITLAFCEYKYMLNEFTEAVASLASDNINDSNLLINDINFEDLGWLVVRRSLALFEDSFLARINLNNLIDNLKRL